MKRKVLPHTLLNLYENPLMKKIMNRGEFLVDTIEDVKKFWFFDMYSRTPSQILENGKIVGTNLDAASLFYTLAERSAVITIPEYKSMRPKTLGESKITNTRTGEIINLSSNKDIFSFSVKIFDEIADDYRNFCITDPNGNLYLSNLTWNMTPEEDKFLIENKIYSDVFFKYFVHPNRWTSFYGQNYFITKALIKRITDECKNYFTQIKKMLKNGIEYPKTTDEISKPWPAKLKEEGKSVKFESLEVEVDFPMFNKYKKYSENQANLVELNKLRKYNIYTVLPILRFATRCSELAFYKHGNNKFPSWIGGGCEWERGFKLPKKRVVWDRLKIVQPAVGEFSIAIRKRLKEKAEIMAKDY